MCALLGLGILSASTTQPIQWGPAAAAAVTWVVVAPIASLWVNTMPSRLLGKLSYVLVGRGEAARIILDGIVGGTVGTLAAMYVYQKLTGE